MSKKFEGVSKDLYTFQKQIGNPDFKINKRLDYHLNFLVKKVLGVIKKKRKLNKKKELLKIFYEECFKDQVTWH